MTEALTNYCHAHDDPYECPDVLVAYRARFNEYGLIVHDGGGSYVLIHYCPWCGKSMGESMRNKWFDELRKLGYDDPVIQDIPAPFKSDKWWRRKSVALHGKVSS